MTDPTRAAEENALVPVTMRVSDAISTRALILSGLAALLAFLATYLGLPEMLPLELDLSDMLLILGLIIAVVTFIAVLALQAVFALVDMLADHNRKLVHNLGRLYVRRDEADMFVTVDEIKRHNHEVDPVTHKTTTVHIPDPPPTTTRSRWS